MVLSAIGTWKWLDKTVLDYTNWGEDEPEAYYGEIDSSDGSWKSGQRWHDRAYICKTPKGKMFLFESFHDEEVENDIRSLASIINHRKISVDCFY